MEGKGQNFIAVFSHHLFYNYFGGYFQSGLAFWPIIQTFNYAVIPERNRVVFVGMASFLWTAYLSYMEANSF